MPEKPLCWKRFQPSAWESKDSYTAKGTGQGVDIGPAEILLGRPDAIAPQWTTASLLAASFMVHCIERGFLGRGQNTHPAGPLLSFSFRERTGERMVTGSKA